MQSGTTVPRSSFFQRKLSQRVILPRGKITLQTCQVLKTWQVSKTWQVLRPLRFLKPWRFPKPERFGLLANDFEFGASIARTTFVGTVVGNRNGFAKTLVGQAFHVDAL